LRNEYNNLVLARMESLVVELVAGTAFYSKYKIITHLIIHIL
jgi:hypothetical protein